MQRYEPACEKPDAQSGKAIEWNDEKRDDGGGRLGTGTVKRIPNCDVAGNHQGENTTQPASGDAGESR